ncbi:MAG: 1-(5-phosphoribosyl)-5-[(5-phosphoribosylamino)methylideneamino]imidazole-4-carboxamide isomerase [Actinomycetota bacterium]|nr:1-(5-phosphoribosyl)-5-[(5-phosphoribosylamino)methylideneamino]imidazole-4-carboxamide isomerase [Actinomycetota bacterium]MDI6821627.1 1-(5-phosphoribosyl)-5-[(5-phosphoribosylamino)methylideneamino]imidazole-4-carboxamide isomerase [Actinomycetota bacterium]
MLIYPAVDILGGKCVRLFQGRFETVKVYSEDPAEMAKRWEDEGAQFLHVVDLNGAASGKSQNLPAIEKIIKSVGIPIQVGGGIRDIKTVEKILDLGVRRAVLGTAVINAPEFVAEACLKFGPKIVAAIDARSGKVAISGWRESTEYDAWEVARELKMLGISRLIYTDILSDGTQRGINFDAVRDMVQTIDISLIVSGGVSSLEDIINLKRLEPLGVEGVIVGTALYEGTFSLKEAMAAAGCATGR